MGKKTIKLPVPIDLRGKDGKGTRLEALELADMTVGDYLDASAKCREGASRAELELEVVSQCSGVSMAVLRAMSPANMPVLSDWIDQQWRGGEASEDGEADADPSEDNAES